MSESSPSTPVAVEVLRGERPESWHRVRLCVTDADGGVRLSVGPVDEPVFPRSAVKPFQALPLVASGAADAFALGEAEIALACASHSGEPEHVERVRGWLARIGAGPAELACGAHPPLDPEVAAALLKSGQDPTPLHNNCSGKHAGMLTLARHLGVPSDGYLHPHHPVQRAIFDILRELTGEPLQQPPGIDGCGVPTWPISLRSLARAAARFATGAGITAATAEAARRILRACRKHPHLVAGSGRPCTRIIPRLAEGMVKAGAEGVYLAILPEIGCGLALKVEDGGGRAAPVALLAALDALGLIGGAAGEALADLRSPIVRNHAGIEVGRIRPRAGWPERR